MAVETILLLLAAASCCILGGIVIWRNPTKRTHRLFAVLALDLMLWAVGVLCIIHSSSESAVTFWVRATFVVASFLPATFYHFIVCFPHQRYDGSRVILGILYAGALFQTIGAFTPWYMEGVVVRAGQAPLVRYGPVFYTFAVWVLTSMVCSFQNLFVKLRHATGVERRQVEHVLIGIFLCTTFATATNVLAPAMNIGSLEVYGPVFTVLMMAILAYAMVRYHLMDIWVLVSRTTIYAIVTLFVIATFLTTVTLVRWAFTSSGRTGDFLTTVLAALVIALVLQPLKERLQLLVERTVLKRRYDVNQLCARITNQAAQHVRLDELLDTVARDIRTTMGIDVVRVWLVDEKDPNALFLGYSSAGDESGTRTNEQARLLEYLRDHPEPIALKQLLHGRANDTRLRIAEHLAELDAYLCLPLVASSNVVGIVTLGEKASGNMYSADDIAVFRTVAGPLGTAIENAELYSKLESLNLHLSRILSSMRGGVVAVDGNGVVTNCNASAAKMLGPIEIGQHLHELHPVVARVLERTLVDGRGIGDFETVIAGTDGEERSVVLSTSSLGTAGNGKWGAMAMLQDLTQVKRLERNVQRADRMSSLGALAAGMAHEVKNPLVSIKTFTQLLLTRFEDDDFRKTFVDVVPHEVDRIDTIVSHLLDFARPKPVRFAPQDLAKIIEKVLALVENQNRKANVTVTLNLPEDGVTVHGDEQQLHQMFLNLFLNAIEAMKVKGGGDLTVKVDYDRTHLHPSGLVPLLEAECVRVTVSDTGCGIPPENLEHLFTPFFTTRAEGSGLGLSVVHGIVTEHRGEIEVDSAPGVGTSFTVTFPLVATAAGVSGVGVGVT